MLPTGYLCRSGVKIVGTHALYYNLKNPVMFIEFYSVIVNTCHRISLVAELVAETIPFLASVTVLGVHQ